MFQNLVCFQSLMRFRPGTDPRKLTLNSNERGRGREGKDRERRPRQGKGREGQGRKGKGDHENGKRKGKGKGRKGHGTERGGTESKGAEREGKEREGAERTGRPRERCETAFLEKSCPGPRSYSGSAWPERGSRDGRLRPRARAISEVTLPEPDRRFLRLRQCVVFLNRLAESRIRCF